MKFYLEDLLVYFPFTYIYPEQYEYMLSLKRGLDAGGAVCLEMPTGTGKTVSLLSLIVSYQLWKPEIGKLIYCCRTVGEVSKTLEELRVVLAYRDSELGEAAPSTLALSLSSRKNLCIHPVASALETRDAVDGACRKMTAPWRREASQEPGNNVTLCDFYEGFEKEGTHMSLSGIYSLEDLKAFGKKYNLCPYFLARHAITTANILVYSYQYMLNPRISELISKQFAKESVVVFDEAHNIDDVCIDALSIVIDHRTLESSSRNLFRLQKSVSEARQRDADTLRREYEELLQGIRRTNPTGLNDEQAPSPVLPDDVVKEAVPEDIRKAEKFLEQARKFLEYVKGRMSMQQVTSSLPTTFLQNVLDITGIEPKTLKFYAARLNKLMRTLEIAEVDQFSAITTVCNFATLCSTYAEGFKIIMEPYDERTPHIPDPILQFACLDAAIAMKPVFRKYRSVVITSGTLSPIDMLPRILEFQPVVSKSLTTTLYRQSVQPLVVSRGSDQTFMSTKFKDRDNMDILRNYGLLLLRMAETVPDGIVAFFTSYHYMESTVSVWNSMGLVNQILKHKLLFVETPDVAETSLALENFKLACSNGRGAIFLSIARGKVSEGIDFEHHYGRCVILFGIPYVYTESRILRARLEFLREKYGIREGDFLTFDAMRTAAQCVGRVIRGKTDYGIMILADKRYNRVDKRSKLPPWILQYLHASELNLSTDGAISVSSHFLRNMAQPVSRKEQIGVSLWTLDDIEKQPTSRNPNNTTTTTQ
eukprot:TRINITY_DN5675_c0_g1_i1.p1 TRINITY_DN5675_c0_g1~~TRINITY_DN5675_c0_g1_i1.p1  ORF type:complete len:762 (+),score=107.42 TRINITY_DN5675_c0_g1_i1:36-2321(+)